MGRYHSLHVAAATIPPRFLIDAVTDDSIVMSIRDESAMQYGVQFHPESMLTQRGQRLIDNFVAIAAATPGRQGHAAAPINPAPPRPASGRGDWAVSVPQRDASNEQNSPIDWPAMPILESVCVTLDPDGTAHAAPLGPRVNVDDPPDRPTFQLRPYDGSATAANLLRTGQATIHATDDAALFVDLVLKASQPPTAEVPHLGASHRRLVRCHRWFAIEVTDRGFTPPLHHLIAKTVASGVNDPFFGFNRAKAALIELAIAATRLSRLDSSVINQQIETFAPQVEKTACPADRAGWDRLVEHLRRQRA